MKKTFDCFKSKNGFTIIELIAGVVIIGVLVSMALPRYIEFKEKFVVAEPLAFIDNGRMEETIRRNDTGITTKPPGPGVGLPFVWNLDAPGNWLYYKGWVDNNTFKLFAIRTLSGGSYSGNTIYFDMFPDNSSKWGGTHPLRPRNPDGS